MKAWTPLTFTCPVCGAVSHHPADVAQGYCGACHDWTARVWDHIAPGRQPGGLWARVTSGGTIRHEGAIDTWNAEHMGQLQALATDAALDAGAEDVRVFFYDGDTGVCGGTMVVTP